MATKRSSGKKATSSERASTGKKRTSGKAGSSGKKGASGQKQPARKGLLAESMTGTMKLRYVSAKKMTPVEHLPEAPTFVKPKRIHPRRFLPLIAEGQYIESQGAAPKATFIHPQSDEAFAEAATPENVVVVKNTPLNSPGQNDTASNVGEPSTAINNQTVFYTGNWYAAVSIDGGNTFQFIDPAQSFSQLVPPGSNFCCDQVVHYIKKIDTFVWLLQYGPDTGDNIQRLAFAKTADVAQGRWRTFDITTRSLGVQGSFLDYPDLAVGANMLYMTTNIFPRVGRPGAAVVRIPLSGIESGQVTAQRFVTMQLDSLRVAQNCDKTAFFATQVDTTTLRVFSWKETAASPTSKDLSVPRFVGGNGYPSRTPDGRRWLDRADPRITGATMAGKDVYFAWGVNRGGATQHPRPFIQIACIDSTTMTVSKNINIQDPDSATCYAALSTNSKNEVGISYMIGGGTKFPSHVVGILTPTLRTVVAAKGDRGPLADPETGSHDWGDYLAVRRNFPNEKLFAATGYTMLGAGDGTNRDSTPRFVIFGRSGDTT